MKVQDLYLDGKKDEAAAALPDELIDLITLCGPSDAVRDRLAAFRGAGVGTLRSPRWRSPAPSGSSSCARWLSWRFERAVPIGSACSWARSASPVTRSRCSRSALASPSAATT